ncbi:MAG: hypothetical protein HY002_21440 [Candidatus Rokubacteria bacterium]|nr:hypothetical protein [Candidatus Rokubacteria bacterium]
MRSILGVALVLSLVTVWSGRMVTAQEGPTKLDRQGPVTVAVTLMAPAAAGVPVKVRVSLDTHSVALDSVAFDTAVAMRMPDGADIAPVAVEQPAGGGHHRQAVLVFPPLAQPGSVRIVVRDVGGVAERTFSWALPSAQ